MEVRVTLEHLRAGEKPLAMFLHDALRSIDGQYFENIVASFARNSRDQGMSSNDHRDRMLDERGRRKTSLEQFDITFLLGLCEWLTAKSTKHTEFVSQLHLHADAYHKFVTLRKYRNNLVHGVAASADLATTIGALGKILDVFRNELLTCCHSQSEIFGEDTTREVQSYVDSIVKLLVDAQDSLKASEPIILEESDVEEVEDVDAQFVDEPVAASSDIVRNVASEAELQPSSKNRRGVTFAIVGAVLLTVVVGALMLLQRPNKDQAIELIATRAAIFIVNEPLTESAAAKFRSEISDILLSSQEYWRITVIRHGRSDTTIVTKLDASTIDERLMNVMRDSPQLPRFTEITHMLDRLTDVLKDTAVLRLRPHAYMFGSLPVPTPEVIAELATRSKSENNILGIQGVKRAFATMDQRELQLFRFGQPRAVDSAVAKTISPDVSGFTLILTDL